MAAPSGTSWGSIVGGYGRIGIYISTSSTATTTTASVQVWFWSKYSVSDSDNTFYANWGTTNATTSQGSRSIKHTVASGSGWNASNQTLLGSYSGNYGRGTSNSTGYFSAKFAGIDRVGGTMTHYVSLLVPARASYTITYNANGGTGAPGAQTKWHDIGINLSSTKPTRTGYTFLGWSLSSTATSASYQPDQSWSGSNNANYTLYAVWEIITYDVTYDANGGTNAPTKQVKEYGKDLTLATAKPTRAEYNFLGWGVTKDSTTVAYRPGATYAENKALTLYAIWEIAYTAPRIMNVVIERCDYAGTVTDGGTYLLIRFSWETDESANTIQVEWKKESDTLYTGSSTFSISGTSGSFSRVVGSGGIDTEFVYNVRVTVSDMNGSSSEVRNVASMQFEIDFLGGGGGVAIGKVATLKDTLEVDYKAKFNNIIMDRFNTPINNGLTKYLSNGIDPDTTTEHAIVTHLKTPAGNDKYMYILTYFYGTKSATANRMQMAFPYNSNGSQYHRYYVNGAWTNWRRHTNADEFADKVVARSASGLWQIREYEDGWVDLWLVEKNYASKHYSQSIWGGVTQWAYTRSYDLPFKLQNPYNISVGVVAGTGTAIVCTGGLGSTESMVQFHWYANTENQKTDIRLQIIGKRI